MKATTAKRGLALLLLLALSALALSGCVLPRSPQVTDTAIGSVQVAQDTGSYSGTTTVEEYGVFYSKSEQAVIDVDASQSALFHFGATIENPDGASQSRVISSQTFDPNAESTMTVNMSGLAPGTTYYFRFYAIGHTADLTQYRMLYTVVSHATLSHDATLKSIATSVGKLSPSFKKSKYSYANVWAKSKKTATITAKPTAPASTIKMRIGSGTWTVTNSLSVSLSKGKSKTVSIKVIATDGSTTKTYKVKVSRKS